MTTSPLHRTIRRRSGRPARALPRRLACAMPLANDNPLEKTLVIHESRGPSWWAL
ncbi:hypothetical protein [Nonomuraea turcica]|uniref:hypothetical protein n=1 Tax=Nonomuraea sp. G32 TaxID=3067274 RepID=UPI00273ACD3E|nr:hypothetical protein [Nonomuraea sp. G32]MDP4510757.1 hypothetical protein [Nonomuraea sp. G32]